MSLQEHQKSFKLKGTKLVSKDDIVLIYEEKQPRQHWRFGRVLEVIESKDNNIRGAKVLIGNPSR